MKSRILLGILFAALLTPAVAEAQEPPEGGALAQVTLWKVTPSDLPQFVEAVGKFAEAARLANLGAQYSWNFWNDLFTYWLVFPMENMAYLDDPEQMVRQIQGTPGEAAMNEAMAAFNEISMRTLSNEIVEVVPAWGYLPASGGVSEYTMAMVGEYWLEPGAAEQWDALVADYITFLQDLDYPYQVVAYRIRVGDEGRRVFATLYDTQEAYYGANSVEILAEQNGMTEAWQGIMERFIQLIVDAKQTDVAFVPEMSHVPEN